ncbi:hypothetical protein QBC34DRAFT_74293 [Podospora aff. communis PSN243]|uniref:Uncharacterized protein n=1 Tax=Podospora aff. communis PSN243 TaxID=3040156 RepID=A0AAV9H5M2_9PEZI|nr:hypothetical protein QBC34DRAFT_74293 [Podospora aff. communis PSN243]
MGRGGHFEVEFSVSGLFHLERSSPAPQPFATAGRVEQVDGAGDLSLRAGRATQLNGRPTVCLCIDHWEPLSQHLIPPSLPVGDCCLTNCSCRHFNTRPLQRFSPQPFSTQKAGHRVPSTRSCKQRLRSAAPAALRDMRFGPEALSLVFLGEISCTAALSAIRDLSKSRADRLTKPNRTQNTLGTVHAIPHRCTCSASPPRALILPRLRTVASPHPNPSDGLRTQSNSTRIPDPLIDTTLATYPPPQIHQAPAQRSNSLPPPQQQRRDVGASLSVTDLTDTAPPAPSTPR